MRVQSNGKIRRSEAEWERNLARFRKSGLSAAALCRREKISKNTLAKWQRKGSSPGSVPDLRLHGAHRHAEILPRPARPLQQVFADQDPYSGSLLLFVNRKGTYLKILAWDRTGFCLHAKKLERGRFTFPGSDAKQDLSEQALRFILDGMGLGVRRAV